MRGEMKISAGGGVSISTVLLIIFVVLKLTGNIDWSWWWVLAPLWIPVGLFVVILLIGFIVVSIKYREQKKEYDICSNR